MQMNFYNYSKCLVSIQTNANAILSYLPYYPLIVCPDACAQSAPEAGVPGCRKQSEDALSAPSACHICSSRQPRPGI